MKLTGRRALAGATLVILAACLELGGPKDGVVSISNFTLPSPSVVVGDVMRDSLGKPAPISIVAFGAAGDTLASEPVTFIAIDTTVTVDAAGTIRGVTKDSVGGRVIAGAGGLQTPPQRVIVTIAPSAVAKGPDTKIQFVNTTPDTSNNSNWSEGLVLSVTGAGTAPAQGYIVGYSIVEMPDAETTGTPTAYIGDDAAKPMPRDTTDTKGLSSRRVILRQSAVAKAIRDGSRSDTVIVRATVKYLGADIPGSPIEFIVPVSRKPGSP
jgi:hypothetical protein